MAGIAYLTEIEKTARDVYRGVDSAPVAVHPAVANQTVNFSTSTASSAFNAKTNFLRIEVTAECFYVVAENPTATSAGSHLAANAVEWICVPPGHKIAFLEKT